MQPRLQRLVNGARALSMQHCTHARALLPTRLAAPQALEEAASKLAAAQGHRVHGAVERFEHAQHAQAQAIKVEAQPVMQQCPMTWLHPRETPSKILTSLIHLPGISKHIPALQCGGGLLRACHGCSGGGALCSHLSSPTN